MWASKRFHFSRLLTRSALCLTLSGGMACGYSIPDSTIAGAALWTSLQTGTLVANQLSVTGSASEVLTYENVTFTAAGGTAPYTYRVSAGGGTITTGGVYTAGAVLGTNTITATDSEGLTGTASVTVQGGLGTGTFMTGVNYPASNLPTAIITADLNNDGVPDLVLGNENVPRGIAVFPGNGDGTFPAFAGVIAASLAVRSITAADFNGDGNPDLATGNTGFNINVFLGNGDATFMSRVDYFDASSPLGIASGDVDGDGVIDLLSMGHSTNNGGFWKGVGDGTFPATPTGFGSLTGPRRLEVADFNNDGNLDVVGNNVSGAPSVDPGATVFLGNGDGSFQTGVQYSAAANTKHLVVGDFNGDARVDFATLPDLAVGDITVFLGNGDGTFQTGLTFTPPSSGIAADGDACDFNGDGRMDLVYSDSANDEVVVLFGDGAGGFAVGAQLPATNAQQGLLCRDLNGDSKMDIVVCRGISNGMRVFIGN